jgi:hypothetical protein
MVQQSPDFQQLAGIFIERFFGVLLQKLIIVPHDLSRVGERGATPPSLYRSAGTDRIEQSGIPQLSGREIAIQRAAPRWPSIAAASKNRYGHFASNP